MQKKLGIIGANGFVGRAMQKLFPNALKFGRDADYKEVNSCYAVFICVPTPLLPDNTLDMSTVEDVVKKLDVPIIIIRSTLQPGFSQYLQEKYNKNISVVPEYVGETVAHPLLDENSRPFLIIGGELNVRKQVIEIFQEAYNANIKIRQVSNYGAELIKLAENRAIAWKVMEIQELYDTCVKAGVDFYTIRDAVYGDDPRFNLWFTFVYPENRGFHSSRCLSKDVPAFVEWARIKGFNPEMTDLLVKKSKEYEDNNKNTLREIDVKSN